MIFTEDNMNILYVASECAPFASSGGLGDVMGALPKFVKQIKPKYNVELIMPLYGQIGEKHRAKLSHVCNLHFKLSWRESGASVYKLCEDGVNYYFIENHRYFERGRLYGEYDDCERFALFCRAVIEFIRQNEVRPNVIHANDWQAAGVILYLKTAFSSEFNLSEIKTLFTIHNIEYQGKFNLGVLGDVFGIDEKYQDVFEFDGAANLLKGALIASDYVNTVSPNYRNELQYDFFAFGLANIISSIKHKTCGIINGIDYDEYSPTVGSDIYARYDSSTADSGKRQNKLSLQKELGFPSCEGTPLLVMVTRLAKGKGIELLIHILDELLSENIQLAILGTGEAEYESVLNLAARKHENFKAILSFDRTLAKKMYAGADIFLMPSKSEPCGLAQMIACSYGAVPIVRSVGGLCDTIIPYGEPSANGFRFDKYNAHELLYTVKRALNIYTDKEKWRELRTSAMHSDFSWEQSAEKYISIYKDLTKKETK